MEDSILISTKKSVGTPSDYEVFDDEIIADINTAFSILYQIGMGSKPFRISGSSETWDEVLPDETSDIDLDEVKSYVRNRVKLLFDPPASGTLVDLLERQCKEFECRISYKVDPTPTE